MEDVSLLLKTDQVEFFHNVSRVYISFAERNMYSLPLSLVLYTHRGRVQWRTLLFYTLSFIVSNPVVLPIRVYSSQRTSFPCSPQFSVSFLEFSEDTSKTPSVRSGREVDNRGRDTVLLVPEEGSDRQMTLCRRPVTFFLSRQVVSRTFW